MNFLKRINKYLSNKKIHPASKNLFLVDNQNFYYDNMNVKSNKHFDSVEYIVREKENKMNKIQIMKTSEKYEVYKCDTKDQIFYLKIFFDKKRRTILISDDMTEYKYCCTIKKKILYIPLNYDLEITKIIKYINKIKLKYDKTLLHYDQIILNK